MSLNEKEKSFKELVASFIVKRRDEYAAYTKKHPPATDAQIEAAAASGDESSAASMRYAKRRIEAYDKTKYLEKLEGKLDDLNAFYRAKISSLTEDVSDPRFADALNDTLPRISACVVRGLFADDRDTNEQLLFIKLRRDLARIPGSSKEFDLKLMEFKSSLTQCISTISGLPLNNRLGLP